jgi:hypothetical protein
MNGLKREIFPQVIFKSINIIIEISFAEKDREIGIIEIGCH